MLSLSVVVVLALLGGSSAFPQGAPSQATSQSAATATPYRDLILGASSCANPPEPTYTPPAVKPTVGGSTSYEIIVSSIPYQPGKDVVVELKSKHPSKPFVGFFIYMVGTDPLLELTGGQGTWKPAPGTNAKQDFLCRKGMIHVDAAPKTSVKVVWTPPASFSHGSISFKAIVVAGETEYYTDVMSSTVPASPTVNTYTQAMLNILPAEQKTLVNTAVRHPKLDSMFGATRRALSQMEGFPGIKAPELANVAAFSNKFASVMPFLTRLVASGPSSLMASLPALLGQLGNTGQTGGFQMPSVGPGSAFSGLSSMLGSLGSMGGASNGATPNLFNLGGSLSSAYTGGQGTTGSTGMSSIFERLQKMRTALGNTGSGQASAYPGFSGYLG